jgi:cobalt-zinc-cadmium efflux system outer membrane protein
MNRYVVMWMVIAVAATARAEPLDSVLTLRQALALALERSPELSVFPAELRASEARILQAGLRPNPEATVTVEDFAGTDEFSGVRQLQTTLQFSQIIELGGKRAARRNVAASALDLTGKEYELKRVEVLADVTEKFITLVGAQQGIVLARGATAAAEAVSRSVLERLEAGKGSSLEEKRAAVALARSRVAEERAGREQKAARQRLAASWGSATPTFERAEADLFALKIVVTFEELVNRIASSPEIARWTTEKRLREAELKLARSKRAPNLTVGGGVRRLEGPDEHALVAVLSLPLPLSDRNQGGRAEARALLEKTELGQQAEESRLRAVLFGLYQELEQAATEVEATRREILPQAEEALKIAEDGFRQGRFSYLELADAQRTLLDVKQQFIVAAETYHKLVAEIERLTGQALQP